MRRFKLVLLLAVCGTCQAERIIFAGFDLSATAWQAGTNPYDAGWLQLLQTVQGGDHVYAAIINERGVANGTPPIDFGVRPYNFLADKRTAYDKAVDLKLKNERLALRALLKNYSPAHGTEIIGFLHAASRILSAYPAKTKQVVIWTDGIQEGYEINLLRVRLAKNEIDTLIRKERTAGRLPLLSGISVWFVTGPSTQSEQMTTGTFVRLEAFWRAYIEACGGTFKGFSPALMNFDHDSQ